MSFLFENLDVYNLALDFHKRILNLCKMKTFKGNYHLTDHLKRASLSISLNIAEGNGRFHKNDRKQFFFIARGSAFECIPILSICSDLGLISKNSLMELRTDIDRISKMLTGLIMGVNNLQR